MIKYPQFYRQFGMRVPAQLQSFKFKQMSLCTLPQRSVYHVLPSSPAEVQVDVNDYFLAKHPANIYCEYPIELVGKDGGPTKNAVNGVGLKRRLETSNRRLLRIRKFEQVERQPTSLLVYGYGALSKLYRYRPFWLNGYFQWRNVFATFVAQAGALAQQSDRQQFVSIHLPLNFPKIAILKRAATGLTRNMMEEFASPESFFLLELWKWAGPDRHTSTMGSWTREQMSRINLVFVDSERCAVVNMALLDEFRDRYVNGEIDETTGMIAEGANEKATELFQRRLLMFAVQMAKLRSVTGAALHVNDEQEETEEGSVALGIAKPNEYTEALRKEEESLKEAETTDMLAGMGFAKTAAVDEEADLDEQAEGEEDPNERIEKIFREDRATVSDADLFNDNVFDQAIPTTDEPEDEVRPIVEYATDPTAGVRAKADELLESGSISVAEHRRYVRLSENYRTKIKMNNGQTLEEFVKITPEMLAIDPAACTFADNPAVADKSMLKSSLVQFDQKYIEQVMERDIASMILAMQAQGTIIEDMRVERVMDAVNKSNVYVVKIVPVPGKPSTLRFPIPVVEKDGTWIANGKKYNLRKQRGDPPIHKVDRATVALTSYYGKLFVTRSEKVVHDFRAWLKAQVILGSTQLEGQPAPSIHNVRYQNGSGIGANEPLPTVYTALAAYFSGMETDELQLSFAYSERFGTFGTEALKLERGTKYVVCGKTKSGELVFMDQHNDLFVHVAGAYTLLGNVGAVLNIDLQRAPLEISQIKVSGKHISLGLVLSYYLGLEQVIKRLGVVPRRVPRGGRLNLESHEFSVRFADCSLIFSRRDAVAALVLGGLNAYSRQVATYNLRDFNKQDIFLSILEGAGMGVRFIRKLRNMRRVFIDPITRDLLREFKEPTEFTALLFRANELLRDDQVMKLPDRFKGYERFAGSVYRELVQATEVYSARPMTANAAVEMKPNAVWKAIQDDPSINIVNDINPIHQLKEQEAVTTNGTGGRSERSMVRRTRAYQQSDFGVISEATVDSSAVAINVFFSADPNLTSLRGVTKEFDRKVDGLTSVLSTSACMAPCAVNDDPKRVNFINIQNSHGLACDGYQHMPLRTGYDQAMAQRLSSLFAYAAKQDGVVQELTPTSMLVQYADGTQEGVELGRRFAVSAGATIPHEVLTDVAEGFRFKRGHVLAWNTGWFLRNRFDPTQVIYRQACLFVTALVDDGSTHEDSSGVSRKASQKLSTNMTEIRTIFARFDQKMSRLVREGDEVAADSILCTIEDPVTANSNLFSETSLDALRMMAAQTPRARVSGRVEKVEVFYHGDKDDMSESLAEITTQYDRNRARRVKRLRVDEATTGAVSERVRIDGSPLEIDNIAIRISITHPISAGVGDKSVFANQMKTIVGRVFEGVHKTESGVEIDAIFGNMSIFNRVVLSPYIIGTTNSLLLTISRRAAELYKGNA